MSSGDRVSIPLLAQLIPGGVKPGTALAVEFDPDSQWLAVASSIIAGSLMNGMHVGYVVFARPVEDAMRDLSNLRVDVFRALKDGSLFIDDWYTATLTGGRLLPSPETVANDYVSQSSSLKVADFSVEQMKWVKEKSEGRFGPFKPQTGWLLVMDSLSVLLRFNEERAFLEWLETREHRDMRFTKRINLEGFVRGVHNESFYKRVEAASEGVVDIRVLEQDGVPKNLLRLRTLKGQPHDARWHEIEIKPDGEAILTS